MILSTSGSANRSASGSTGGSANAPGLRAEQLLGALIRRSAPWVAAAGLLCVGGYLALDGAAAAAAALLGLGLVLVFFGVDLVVMRLTRRSPGGVTAGALMGEYVLKVVLLAAVLWGISTSTQLDLQPTAVTVVVTTVIGAVAITVAALRVRSFTFDFPVDAPADSANDRPGNETPRQH